MSDRCTFWLSSPAERHANYMARQRAYERAQIKAMQDLVIEFVHPGNLGPLPPSPDMIAGKARLMGIHWWQ